MAHICAASSASCYLLDLESPGTEKRLINATGVRSVQFNHTGRVVALADSSGQVGLYDTASLALLGELPPSLTRMSSISTIAFSRGSKLLALAGSARDVQLFDLRSQCVAKVLSGHTHALTSVTLSANDAFAASAATAGDVRVHALATGAEACALDPIDSVAKSHLTYLQENAQMLAAGGDRGGLYVWDTFQSQTVASFPRAHIGPVTGLLPLNDPSGGSALFSTGLDRALLLTDLRSKSPAVRAETPFAPTCLAAREGTGQLAIGTSPGVVLLYDFRDLSKPLSSKMPFSSAVVDLKFRREHTGTGTGTGSAAASPAKKAPGLSATSSAAVTPSKDRSLPSPNKPTAGPPQPQPPSQPQPQHPSQGDVRAATLPSRIPEVPERSLRIPPPQTQPQQTSPQPQPQQPAPSSSAAPPPPPASAPLGSSLNAHEGHLEEASGDPLMTTFRGLGELLALGRSMNAATATAELARAGAAGPPLGAAIVDRIEDDLAMGGGAAGGTMLQTILEGTEDGMSDTPPRSLANSRDPATLPGPNGIHRTISLGTGAHGQLGQPSPSPSSFGPGPSRTELFELVRVSVKQAVGEATAALRDDLRELQLEAIRNHVEVTEQLMEIARRQEMILQALGDRSRGGMMMGIGGAGPSGSAAAAVAMYSNSITKH